MNPEMILIVDYLDNMDAINSELSKSKVWNSLQAVKGGTISLRFAENTPLLQGGGESTFFGCQK